MSTHHGWNSGEPKPITETEKPSHGRVRAFPEQPGRGALSRRGVQGVGIFMLKLSSSHKVRGQQRFTLLIETPRSRREPTGPATAPGEQGRNDFARWAGSGIDPSGTATEPPGNEGQDGFRSPLCCDRDNLNRIGRFGASLPP